MSIDHCSILRNQQVRRATTMLLWYYLLQRSELKCSRQPLHSVPELILFVSTYSTASLSAFIDSAVDLLGAELDRYNIMMSFLTSPHLQRLSHTPNTPHRHSPHNYVLSTFLHRTKLYQCNSPDLSAVRRTLRVHSTHQRCYFWYLRIERWEGPDWSGQSNESSEAKKTTMGMFEKGSTAYEYKRTK